MSAAALALVTLASCSNDLFEKDGLFADGAKKGDIEVTVEEMVDPVLCMTRSAMIDQRTSDGKKNVLTWMDGDEIVVYNADLTRYDPFVFRKKAGAFVAEKGQYVTSPKFALYIGGGYSKSNPGWNRNENTTSVDVKVPETILTWSDDVEDVTDGAAYVSNLPMWGTAEFDEELGMKTQLQYLTGIMKISLQNVAGNATKLRVAVYTDVSAKKPANLSGTFRATLAKGDNVQSEAQLEAIAAEDDNYMGDYKGYIDVDLTDVTKKASVIYVPIIAGKYGVLRIMTSLSGNFNDAEVLKTYESKTIERGKVYAPTLDVEGAFTSISGASPSAISAALLLGETELTCSQKTTVSNVEATKDDVITIPRTLKDAESITINFKDLVSGAAGTTLYIEDDDFEPFTGTLYLNIDEEAVKTNMTTIEADLPKGNLVLTGKYGNAINLKVNANGVAIGNDDAVETIFGNINDENSAFASLAVNPNSTVGTIAAPEKVTVTIAEATAETPISITSIDVKTAITIPANATVNALTSTGDITIYGLVKGNVTAPANVTVARTTEGEAITGTLTMSGAGKTLTLTGGYIGTLALTGKNLTIANEEVVPTAIAAYTAPTTELTAPDVAIKDYTSKWCGSTMSTTAKGAAQTTSTLQTLYGNKAKIFTATQFAEYKNVASAVLMGNIDLNNQAFTPVADVPATGFDGKNKTVKNVSITKTAATNDQNVGLFLSSQASAENPIKNLTIENINITATSKVVSATNTIEPIVGALVGSASGKILNVQVNGGEIASDGGIVGGLVGKASNELAIEGAVQGTGDDAIKYSTVSLDAIEGAPSAEGGIGGILGYAGAATTITLYKAATAPSAFSVTTTTSSYAHTSDNKFGRVGLFVGSGSAIVTFGAKGTNGDAGLLAMGTTNFTIAQKIALGFMNNFVQGEGTDSGNYYAYYGRPEIGYKTAESVKFGAAEITSDNNTQQIKTVAAANTAATGTDAYAATTNENKNYWNVFLLEGVYK